MLMKRIADCPNYLIREDGLIWSTISKKFMTPYISNAGYLNIKLKKDTKKVSKLVHRLLAETFIDNPSSKATCNHKDGNRLNNALNNLEWNTYSENNQHAWDNFGNNRKKNLSEKMKGLLNKAAKLSDQDVLNIRKEYVVGNTSWRKLAVKYNVAKSTIARVLSKKTWAHL